MPENKSFKCNQCDGRCEGLKTTAKAYCHWIIKVILRNRNLKRIRNQIAANVVKRVEK